MPFDKYMANRCLLSLMSAYYKTPIDQRIVNDLSDIIAANMLNSNVEHEKDELISNEEGSKPLPMKWTAAATKTTNLHKHDLHSFIVQLFAYFDSIAHFKCDLN